MKISHQNWNKQSGQIDVLWKSKDYENHNWIPNKDRNGYQTNETNYNIYNNRLGHHILDFETPGKGIDIPAEMKNIFDYVPKLFDLEKTVYSFMKFPVGHVLPWHSDNYPTYCRNNNVQNIESIVRIIVLLHDSTPGQQLWIEDKIYHGAAGSWFSWEGRTQHMAANLSNTDRYVLQITGVKCE